jgi:hypothetical protein
MRPILRLVLGPALALTLAGCGGTSPASPAAPAAIVDLTGIWNETGGSVTWRLAQGGAGVTGTSSFSQDNGRFIGAVSGQGTVTGTVADGAFSFTDTYATLSRPNCSLVVTGSLVISGNQMAGRYQEVDFCDGAMLGTVNGTIALRKQ